MKKIILILIIAINIFSLSACNNVPVWKYSMFKRPSNNNYYPPLYLKGWQDGCESGAQASSNYFYRAKYEFKQDWRLLNNPTYINGWEDSYNQCRKYILQNNLGNS